MPGRGSRGRRCRQTAKHFQMLHIELWEPSKEGRAVWEGGGWVETVRGWRAGLENWRSLRGCTCTGSWLIACVFWPPRRQFGDCVVETVVLVRWVFTPAAEHFAVCQWKEQRNRRKSSICGPVPFPQRVSIRCTCRAKTLIITPFTSAWITHFHFVER